MKRNPPSYGSRIGSYALLGALALVASFCRNRLPPEGECVFNSDCDDGDVCAGRYCRKACNARPNVTQAERDRDCPATFTCRPADNGVSYACYPPNTPYRCVYHSECNQMQGEICARDGFCRKQCVGDYDCQVLTGNRASRCIPEDAGLGGTCDFRAPEVDTDGGTSDRPTTDTSAPPADSATPADR